MQKAQSLKMRFYWFDLNFFHAFWLFGMITGNAAIIRKNSSTSSADSPILEMNKN